MPKAAAFTLVEVVVALGLLAGVVILAVSLQSSINRSIADAANQGRAAQMVDAILVELERIRDTPAANGAGNALEALASIVPGAQDASALRLVGASTGTQVVLESEADSGRTTLASAERFFLVEVRQEPPPLGYSAGAGFLALRLRISWPYRPSASGTNAAVDSRISSLVFNAALTP
jgi:type II secretory pathway pseudopilin PulG